MSGCSWAAPWPSNRSATRSRCWNSSEQGGNDHGSSLDKYRDIFDKKAFCHLATVGRDGRPQVTPVWCDFDGTYIRVNTARGRVKDKNLKAKSGRRARRPGPDNPYRYVQVRGRVAEMTEKGADEHIDALAKKYMGKDKYPYRQPGEVRVIAKIKPESVQGMGR